MENFPVILTAFRKGLLHTVRARAFVIAIAVLLFCCLVTLLHLFFISDTNVFWKLPVHSPVKSQHSGPPMPTHILQSPQTHPTPFCLFLDCLTSVTRGLQGDKGEVSEV